MPKKPPLRAHFIIASENPEKLKNGRREKPQSYLDNNKRKHKFQLKKIREASRNPDSWKWWVWHGVEMNCALGAQFRI